MSDKTNLHPYEYRPLREGPNNIRLLQILPGVGDAEIVCQVFQYTLRNEKAFGLYEALSYVWGDFDDPHEILVKNSEDLDFRKFTITRNLYGALKRLRDPDLPRTFWIDAICINQGDLQERAAQVQIMARIYAYAVSVSVWLGEEADESSTVFDLLRNISAEDYLGEVLKWSDAWWDTVNSRLVHAINALEALLDRSWFRRAWVVQEAAVARVVSVTCGDAETTGTSFASGIDIALTVLNCESEKQRQLPPVLMFMDRSKRDFPLLRETSTIQSPDTMPSFKLLPLGDLLKMFENHEATDQRDKIYALLGLSSDNDLSPNLRPDYTRAWSDLFRQVVVHVLGPSTIVSIIEDKEQAVISEFGCALGMITHSNEKEITVKSPPLGCAPGKSYYWEQTWAVPHHCGSVKAGDILVFLQEARRPSILRTCGDHFDVVMISLPAPLRVAAKYVSGGEVWVSGTVDWADLMHGIRNSARKFTLVWNPSQHDQQEHNAHIGAEPGTHPNSIERCFNTARVLDDMEQSKALITLLKARPSKYHATSEEKHLILLEHISVYWGDYLQMRDYLSTLRWCIWALNAAINSDYLLDYWYCGGCILPDLYEIVGMAEANQGSVLGLQTGYEPYLWQFEEFGNCLFPILFPSYQVAYSRTTSYKGIKKVLAPHNGRYMMNLILSNEKLLTQPSDATLDRFYNDPVLCNMYPHVLAILAGHNSLRLDMDSNIQYALEDVKRLFKADYLNLLVRESSYSTVSIYNVFNALVEIDESHELDPYKLQAMVLIPNLNVIIRHVKDLGLCQLEIDLWRHGHTKFDSVLCFLRQYFVLTPLYKKSESTVSTHNLSGFYSTESLVRWARKAVLQTIHAFRQRRIQHYFRAIGPDDATDSSDSAG